MWLSEDGKHILMLRPRHVNYSEFNRLLFLHREMFAMKPEEKPTAEREAE